MTSTKIKTLLSLSIALIASCQNDGRITNSNIVDSIKKVSSQIIKDTLPKRTLIKSKMMNVIDSLPNAVYDIRYADTNNFTHKKLYPCAACYLRPEAFMALKIVEANAHKLGFKLLIYDCFRPLEIQKKLWEIMPNPIYVTPPDVGSQHNRGLAVDLTLADLKGTPIDMGSPYDDFSLKSHWSCKTISTESLANRNLLKKLMKTQGFDTINSEWWHYSYNSERYQVENEVWECR